MQKWATKYNWTALPRKVYVWGTLRFEELTCPCALVTSCPVAPCRFDRVFPNT